VSWLQAFIPKDDFHSLPRLIRRCRGIELVCSQQTRALFGAHSALASAILSDALMQAHMQRILTDLSYQCVPYQLMWQNPEKNMCEWFSPFRLILPSAWVIGWWKTIHIRSFHSSVLILEHSPSAERLIIPLVVLNPKDISKCGPPSRVRWAESGGWHDASWNDLPLDVWHLAQQMAECHILPCSFLVTERVFFFLGYVLSYVPVN
jgi:hypothetical protein